MVLAVAWVVVAVAAALLLGAAIRLADGRAALSDHLSGLPADLTVDDVLGIPRPLPTAH